MPYTREQIVGHKKTEDTSNKHRPRSRSILQPRAEIIASCLAGGSERALLREDHVEVRISMASTLQVG
jgi:hypothetical protein